MTAKLLSLYGTLEINYKNNNYNIPICIWLPVNYPLSAPLIYVKPTPNMLIRTSKYVDSLGKVYHPQLAYWKQDSSLLVFLRVLQQIFSLEPPVYSRPVNNHAQSSNPAYNSSSNLSYAKPSNSHVNYANRSNNSNINYGSPPTSSYTNNPNTNTVTQSNSNWRPSKQVSHHNPKEDEIAQLRIKLTEKVNQKATEFLKMLDQAAQEQINVNRKLIASQDQVDLVLKQLNLSCVIISS